MEGHPTRDPRRRSLHGQQSHQRQELEQPHQPTPPRFDPYSFQQGLPPPTGSDRADHGLSPPNGGSALNGYGQSGAGQGGFGGYDMNAAAAAAAMWGMPPPNGPPIMPGGGGGPPLPSPNGGEHMGAAMNPWLPPPQMHQLAMAMYAAGPHGMMNYPPPPIPGMPHPMHHVPQLSVGRADEEALAYALRTADACGGSRRIAIEEFAMKRNQPAISWKDYYLDHYKRIDGIVNGSLLSGTSSARVTSPFLASPSPPESFIEIGSRTISAKTGKARPGPRSVPGKAKQKAKSEQLMEESPPPTRRSTKRKARSPSVSSSPDLDEQSEDSEPEHISAPRKTMSGRIPKARALSGPSKANSNRQKPIRDPPKKNARARRSDAELPNNTRISFAPTRHRLPLLQSDVHIPDIPERSPTPPTEVIPSTTRKGVSKYTEADRDYFVRFILYELRKNPELSKWELCQMLEEKAPHHSAESWRSHWSTRHAIADNIMRLADEWREEMEGPNQDVSESEATEETPEAHESPGLVNSSFKVDEYETPDEDEASDSEDPGSDSSENKMGGENKTLTRGDMQVMARLVAGMSAQEWKSLSRTGRWERMAKKYPARTAQAWLTHYRRRKQEVHALAQKYRRRERLRREKSND